MQIIPEQHVPVSENTFLSGIPLLERARLACNTVKEIEKLAGGAKKEAEEKTPETSDEDKATAREVFKTVTDPHPVHVPSISTLASYPNESLRYLDRMLSEYDHELINSAVRIREYTKNKLLVDSENPDGKIRIRALELLGKMKDVGLFTDRLEITNKTKTDEELESELTKKLERYMGSALVVEPEEENEEENENQPKGQPDTPKPVDINSLGSFIDSLNTPETTESGPEHPQ